MEFQVVLSDPKTGKAYKIEVKGEKAERLVGKRIGDVLDGDILGLRGFKVQITGGTDRDGFPMRPDIPGTGRRRVLLSAPPGFRPKEKGQRRRKTVRGNEISAEIAQINMRIVEFGEKPVEEILLREGEESERQAAEEVG